MLTITCTPIATKQGTTKSGKAFRSYKVLTDKGDVHTVLDFTGKEPLTLNKPQELNVGVPDTTPLFLRN